MRPDTIRLFYTMVLALFLTACKTVTVTNPEANKVYTAAPDVQLAFPKGKPDGLKVLINDADITALLTVTDTGATAAGASIAAYLADGDNYLRVASPATPAVKFVFDKSGPTVHITKVTEGASLAIQGYVEDPSGVKSVTVNGAALSLGTGNTFSTTVANGSYVTFVSTDNINLVRTQKFARPSVTMANSVSLRINRRGLDFLTAEVQSLLKSAALGRLIAGMNPLKSDSIPLIGEYQISVTDARIGDAKLNLVVKSTGDGSFDVSGSITNFWAAYSLWFKSYLGWASTVTGTVTVDTITFAGSAKAGITAGKVNLTLGALTLNLGEIKANFGILPSWLVSPFINAFKFIVEWILTEQVKQILPSKLSELLDTFPSTLLVEINGSKIKPEILPSSISSPSNGINLGLGARLINVTTTGPKVLGSAFKDMGNAPAASTVSPSGVEKDIGVVLTQNVVNQALSSITAAGMLSISLTEADIPGIGNLQGVSAEENVRVRVMPSSAPTIELVKSANGLGTLRFHDLGLALDGTIDDTGALKLIMGAVIDVEATADLGVAANGTALAIEFAGTPRIKVRSIDPASALTLPQDLAQRFLDELTPKVLPVVMGLIGAIPLPSFEGYSLSVGDIWVTDASANHVGLVANLVKVTTTASAPVPTTYATVQNATVSSRSGIKSAAASAAVDVSGKVVSILLDGYNPSEGKLQYRYSVDGAPFSPWKERSKLRLHGLSAGLHTVQVCARTALLAEDPACTSVSFNLTP
jgi:hypothetical protein